jgi:serine/threonine protein kinase
MTDRVGQQLGNYRLIRLLGEGGFAEVYLGEHIHLGTEAALKVLHTQLTNEDVEQFRQEARTIARLRHRHIVRVLDFGVEGKTPFLVMDYAPKGTLRQHYPKGTVLPVSHIVTYVKQAAAALQFAHEQKLIHRDIKPENMLLESENEILLSDFGIALVAQSSRYQSTQNVVGTVAYMSPEQIQGKPRPASDQYSLAIVVYEWLSGSRPFHGSFTEICTQHMFAPPPPLREKVPHISSDIEYIVMTALTKDPRQRFTSVQAFATALEQATQLAGPIPITPPPEPLPPTQAVKPTPLPPAQAVKPTPLPPAQAVKPTPSLEILSTYRDHQGEVYTVAWSPDGKHLASGGRDRTVQIWGFSTGKRVVTYRGYADPIAALAWSPDGKYLAFSSGHQAQVWNTTTHKLLLTYRGYADPIAALAWSPDGQYLAFSSGHQAQVWNTTTDKLLLTYAGHSGRLSALAWSPDGKHLASGGRDRTVQIWGFSTGKRVVTHRGYADPIAALAWSPDGQYLALSSSNLVQVRTSI